MFPDSRVCASVCPGKVWGAGRARPRELVVWRAPAPLPRGLGGLGWGQNCTLLWAALPATVPGLEPRVPLLRRACLRGRGHTHSASRGPGRGAAAEAHAQCVRTWVFCTAECVTLAPPSLTLPVMEGKHSPQTAGVGTQQLVLRGVPFPSRAGGCPPSQPAPDGPPPCAPPGLLLGDVPNRQPVGIVLTVVGVVVLDFSADATEGPIRAYLLDVVDSEEQDMALNIHAFSAGESAPPTPTLTDRMGVGAPPCPTPGARRGPGP